MDFSRKLITLGLTKSGDVQYVPLTDEAVSILRGLDSRLRSKWVFPSENLETHLDPCNFFRRIYLPAVKRARLQGVNWHTLRHTFASRLAMSGATDYDIAACLRHSSTALVKRYAHLSPTYRVREKIVRGLQRSSAGEQALKAYRAVRGRSSRSA